MRPVTSMTSASGNASSNVTGQDASAPFATGGGRLLVTPRRSDWIDTVSGASFSIGAVMPPRAGAPTDGVADLPGFIEDVAPLLALRCGECHAGADAAGGLDLAADEDTVYAALLERHESETGAWAWVDAESALARASFLIEVLRGRELDSARSLPGLPHPPAGLTDDELRLLALWIDLGAARAHRYPGADE
jgi:hypothetical protein